MPGFVSWVGSDLHYLGVNRNLADVFQLAPEDFVGKEVGFMKTSPPFAEFMQEFLQADLDSDRCLVTGNVNSTLNHYLIAAQKYQNGEAGEAAVSVGIDITELQQVKAQLQAVLDAVPGFVSWVSADLRYLGVNQNLAASFNLPPEAFFGKSVGFLKTSPHFADFMREVLNSAEPGGRRVIRSLVNGSERDFLVVAQKYQQGTATISIGIDITERQRAEEALRESEKRYRILARKETLLNQLARQIRNSLDLDTILETTAGKLYELLEVDRCQFLWYHLSPESQWECVREMKRDDVPSGMGFQPFDGNNPSIEKLLNLELVRLNDVEEVSDPAAHYLCEKLGYRALLALPVRTPSQKLGLVCCGHHRSPRFWRDREVELLEAVGTQLAIALSQAELYNQARQSAALAQERAAELESALEKLKNTQARLIQSEKMVSLGQLVAGITHEINNPVSFVYGNVTHAQEYVADLLEIVELYRENYPEPQEELVEALEDVDLDFLQQDLPRLMESMKVGAARISEIVRSMRTFSRHDEAEKKQANIQEGIESTLLILQNRLKAKGNSPAIETIENYAPLPKVECYPGELNQVFMNILTNAIDALEEKIAARADDEEPYAPKIWISTERLGDGGIAVRIRDNGPGIPESAHQRLFDPFYTTKPPGKGTGLGLSISYQIVVERHQGKLLCQSAPAEGTEFVIELPYLPPSS